MKKEELGRFKAILLELEKEIAAEIAQDSAAESSIEPDNAIGRLTRMEAIQAKSISDAGNPTRKAADIDSPGP